MRAARAVPFVLAPVLLAACRTARTDVQDVLPDALERIGDDFVHASPGEIVDLSATRWWSRFQDPVLNTLVEAALAGNLDLMQAAANVRAADARARSARGNRGPAVDAALVASRSVANPLGTAVYSTVLTPQIAVSWQADLFGRLRSIERARFAELLASEADHLAIAHSLVAEAVRFRVRVSLLERELALALEVVASRTRTLEIVEGRYERGLPSTSAVDIHLARENLAAARAVLPAIERDLDQTYLALDLLLGRKPGQGARLESLATPLPNTASPPTGFPASLLDRRPDLCAARLRVESAAAEVDVSIAALYPDLILSGSAGWSDDDLGGLFSAESFFASLVGNLTAPCSPVADCRRTWTPQRHGCRASPLATGPASSGPCVTWKTHSWPNAASAPS